MQPKHTEPPFISAAAGLSQGRDPEGMKHQAVIRRTPVKLPSVKILGTRPSTCLFSPYRYLLL